MKKINRTQTVSLFFFVLFFKKKNQSNSKKEKKKKKNEETETVQSGNAVVLVTSNVEPSTGIDESRIPTLKHVIRIGQAPAESVESVAFRVGKRNVKNRS